MCAEELQLQMANDDGNMSLSAVNLIQHLIGMSQVGNNSPSCSCLTVLIQVFFLILLIELTAFLLLFHYKRKSEM